jgi:hypothetical protein
MSGDFQFRLHKLLEPHVLDGTELHQIVEDLVAAVRAAKDDPVRIASARLDAKTRIRAVLAGCVHRDAAINATILLLSGVPL